MNFKGSSTNGFLITNNGMILDEFETQVLAKNNEI